MEIKLGNKIVEYMINENNCWDVLFPQIGISEDKYGYPRMWYSKNTRAIYKVSYSLFIREIGMADGIVIRHMCDNKLCINPDHLLEGTHQDNVADRVSRNRSAIGENNGRSKLTKDEVMYIKHSPERQYILAKQFNVDRKVIYDIKNNITWKHIN